MKNSEVIGLARILARVKPVYYYSNNINIALAGPPALLGGADINGDPIVLANVSLLGDAVINDMFDGGDAFDKGFDQ